MMGIEIRESIALDDSCQRKLFAYGHLGEVAFRAACVEHLQSHAACCAPKVRGISVGQMYMRRVPMHGSHVSDSRHVISGSPGRGARKVTMLTEWLPLHPCPGNDSTKRTAPRAWKEHQDPTQDLLAEATAPRYE